MFEKIKNFWKMLEQPIYSGERLDINLRAITYVSTVSAVLGLIMVFINSIQHRGMVTLTSYAFLIFGTICAVSAGVFKNRKIAVAVASILSAFIFTYYLLSGETDGAAILWVMAMPMGISYFMSVIYGIILSVYYELLVVIMFYTPLKEFMSPYYSESIMTRYPIVFFCVASFTLIGMTQYHATVLREIDYAKRLKDEVETQKKISEELEKVSAARSRFFATMSHEIRTPINAIIGFNEMILREKVSNEILEDSQNIQSASKLLLHLINDILDLSKLDSGKMELSLAPYRTVDLIVDVAGMFAVRSNQKGLELGFDISPDIPSGLIGDEVRIKQILINLVNNAIKYTYEGSVTISASWKQNDETSGEIIYHVSDTGIGIKEEDIPYLFTAYRRADEDDTKHIEGTGLGLSIVQQFIDLMKGSVSVESVYGKGSTFTVTIPQKIANEETIGLTDIWMKRKSKDSAAHHSRFEAPDAHILIVDDTTSNILVTTKLLRSIKSKTDTAENGLIALDKTLHRHYDVILLDHFMPNMDGMECLHKIREQKNGLCRDSKILALTANTVDDNGSVYLKEGFDGFLQKPFTGEQLEQAIYKMLPENLIKVHSNVNDFDEVLEFFPAEESITSNDKTIKASELSEEYIKSLEEHGINVNGALMYCGNDKLIYSEILNDYLESIPQKCEKLKKFFAEKNWKEYAILTHAIKSTSKTIGANTVSEKARQLEAAAKDNDIETIFKCHEDFLEEYSRLYVI